MNSSLQSTITSLPSTPGVYQMFNDKQEIIYIGKAKDLKKRVSSYFQTSRNHSIKTKKLVKNIAEIQYIETNSELEAIILETNLIKENRPKYNILMKDDKNYIYIKITNEDFPQVCTVRKRLNDKARYFGPKTSGMAVKQTLNFLNKLFPYRTCTFEICETDEGVVLKSPNRKIPCLDYHIKRCIGPCIGEIKKTEYKKIIEQIINFLEGKHQPVVAMLKENMQSAAQNKDFEKAARIRDQIAYIEQLNEKQLVSDSQIVDRDVIGYKEFQKNIYVNLFQIRAGKIINRENFILKQELEGSEDVLSAFMQSYYSEASDIPDEILISREIAEQKLLESWLKEVSGHTVKILVPQKGQKNKLIELSEKNADSFYRQSSASWSRGGDDQKYLDILNDLQEKLKLNNLPSRIECYDISHLSGTATVGSMVVFENGEAKKKDYRRFKIDSLKDGEIDDYKAMSEVLKRRLARLHLEEKPKFNIQLRRTLKKDFDEIKKITKQNKLKIENFNPREYTVAEDSKKIIALGRLQELGDKILLLSSLWVGKKYRGDKIGWKIMKKIFENHKGKDVYTFAKKNNTYYEAFGFRKIEISIPEILKKMMHKSTHCLKFKIPKESSFDLAPQLMVIDGGKGQLSAARKILDQIKMNIDLISLAKREEEVFKSDSQAPIILPRTSEALYLLQRIRDEAHRFAITYNKNMRAKKDHKSALDSIEGIGPKTRKKLLKTFGSVAKMKEHSIDDIAQICGYKLAQKIMQELI